MSKKVTSPKIASIASDLLRDGRTSKNTKSVAASLCENLETKNNCEIPTDSLLYSLVIGEGIEP